MVMVLPIYGIIHEEKTVQIQNWAGRALRNITFLKDWDKLTNISNSIILLETSEANFRFDLTKQLISNNNYIVFLDPYENSLSERDAIVADIPEAIDFPIIVGGERKDCTSINVDTWFFLTLTDINWVRAKLYTVDKIFSWLDKPYKFTWLNGRHCDHRWKLRNLLLDQVNHSIHSYIGYPTTDNTEDVCPIDPVYLPKAYESEYVDLDSVPTVGNDERNMKSFRHHYWAAGNWTPNHIVPAQYTDSYFSLVTESMIDHVFLTEKTWKPILAGHPFVLLGAYGTYAKLHDMGFKTFDKWIDESFDVIEDNDQRINAVADSVLKLLQTDLKKFLTESESICRYNQQHYKDIRYTHFEKIHHDLVNFLDSNLPS
jgi:hypothetical protein